MCVLVICLSKQDLMFGSVCTLPFKQFVNLTMIMNSLFLEA